MKINCIEPVLAPYSIPRFTALQSLRRDDSLLVMALGATERIHEWQLEKTSLGFEYAEAFPGATVGNIEQHALAERVTGWLDDSDPQVVVISGYYYRAMRAAAQWARQRKRVSIYMGDSQWVDRRRNVFKEWAKGWWVRRHYDAAFVAGERAATHLTQMGFLRERIWTGYDVVDNRAFAAGAEAARSDSDALRIRLGLPERYFLSVVRFAREKNLPCWLEAYAKYRAVPGRRPGALCWSAAAHWNRRYEILPWVCQTLCLRALSIRMRYRTTLGSPLVLFFRVSAKRGDWWSMKPWRPDYRCWYLTVLDVCRNWCVRG